MTESKNSGGEPSLVLPPEVKHSGFLNPLDYIPTVLERGIALASTAHIMRLQLEHQEKYPDLVRHCYDTSGIWAAYLFTSDIVAYKSDDDLANEFMNIIFTTDKEHTITKEGRAFLGLMNRDNYDIEFGTTNLQMDGKVRESFLELLETRDTSENKELEFTIREYDKSGNRCMGTYKIHPETNIYFKKRDILNDRLFRVLARDPSEVPKEFAEDKHLLKDYLNYISASGDEFSPLELRVGTSHDNDLQFVQMIRFPRPDTNISYAFNLRPLFNKPEKYTRDACFLELAS